MGQYAKGAANTRPSNPRPPTQARAAKATRGSGSSGDVSGGARSQAPLGPTTLSKGSSMRTAGPSPSRSVAYAGRKK